MSIFELYAEALEHKKALVAEKKKLDAELRFLEGKVLDHFVELGIDRATVKEQNVTLSVRKIVSAKMLTPSRIVVAEALAAAGLDHLLREDFNLRRVSTYFAEEMEHEGNASIRDALPPELVGVIELQEVFRVGSTKRS